MPARTVRRPVTSKPQETEDSGYDGDGDVPEDRPARRASSRPTRREAPARDSGRARPKARQPEPDEEDGDDEDETQTRKTVRGGWKTFKQQREAASDFATNFKVELNETYIIKFLDEEPFASFRQHWIDEAPKKKSFVCLEESCPLCDILNDKPRALAMFNVVEFVEVIDKGETLMDPQVKVWEVGTSVGGQLETLADDPKIGPLTDGYWSVSKSGKGSKTRYTIMKVKERDLAEDHGIDPLTDDEIDALDAKKYDSSEVRYPKRSEMKELARDVAGSD